MTWQISHDMILSWKKSKMLNYMNYVIIELKKEQDIELYELYDPDLHKKKLYFYIYIEKKKKEI